ncbi:MAG TPA: papain-like cysteine protease family protein [Thermoanaerobaculia bacterium]
MPLPLQGGTWEASTNVKREEQRGNRWCWAACVAMVLKAFGNPKRQCTIAKAVCEVPCNLEEVIMDGCDEGYEVDKIKALWEKHGVLAKPHLGAVGWDVIEQELKPKKDKGEPSRPVEIFLGIGDAGSKDGHLVLIVGAEMTASGKRAVSIADPVSINSGLAPADFDLLEAHLQYGKWSRTWTNLFWKKGS